MIFVITFANVIGSSKKCVTKYYNTGHDKQSTYRLIIIRY